MAKNQKLALTILLLLAVGCVCSVAAQVSAGVKDGDYVVYEVTSEGTTQKANLVAERIDFQNVQESQFTANITLIYDNATVVTEIRSFNFPEGQVGKWEVIPANLGLGDSFQDASTGQSVTIQGQEQKTVMEATRTVTSVSTPQLVVQWDKPTGVMISKVEHFQNYTLTTTAVATNMWKTQILGLDRTVFFEVVIGTVAAAAIVVTAVVFLREKKGRSRKN
jgi:hypothetical protein